MPSSCPLEERPELAVVAQRVGITVLVYRKDLVEDHGAKAVGGRPLHLGDGAVHVLQRHQGAADEAVGIALEQVQDGQVPGVGHGRGEPGLDQVGKHRRGQLREQELLLDAELVVVGQAFLDVIGAAVARAGAGRGQRRRPRDAGRFSRELDVDQQPRGIPGEAGPERLELRAEVVVDVGREEVGVGIDDHGRGLVQSGFDTTSRMSKRAGSSLLRTQWRRNMKVPNIRTAFQIIDRVAAYP